jgi:hypothetical protein
MRISLRCTRLSAQNLNAAVDMSNLTLRQGHGVTAFPPPAGWRVSGREFFTQPLDGIKLWRIYLDCGTTKYRTFPDLSTLYRVETYAGVDRSSGPPYTCTSPYFNGPRNARGWLMDDLYEELSLIGVDVMICPAGILFNQDIPLLQSPTLAVNGRKAPPIDGGDGGDWNNGTNPNYNGDDPLDPNSYTAYADLMEQFALRYGPTPSDPSRARVAVDSSSSYYTETLKIGLNTVKYFQCGNEDNFPWHGGPVTFDWDVDTLTGEGPNASAAKFYACYRAVRRSCPDAKLVTASILSANSSWYVAFMDAFDAYWEEENPGVSPPRDFYLSWHRYHREGGMGQTQGDDVGETPEAANSYDLGEAFDDLVGAKGLLGHFCTETGWNDETSASAVKQRAKQQEGYTLFESAGLLDIRNHLIYSTLPNYFATVAYSHQAISEGQPYTHTGYLWRGTHPDAPERGSNQWVAGVEVEGKPKLDIVVSFYNTWGDWTSVPGSYTETEVGGRTIYSIQVTKDLVTKTLTWSDLTNAVDASGRVVTPMPTDLDAGSTPTTVSVAVTGSAVGTVGQTIALTARATLSDGSTPVVTGAAAWTTSDPAVATVGASTGLVTLVSAGSVTITATYDGQSDNLAITVSAAAGGLPGAPAVVSPANGAVDIGVSPVFEWSSADADTYDIYFGTANPPTNIVRADITQTSGQPPSALNYDTTYYWKVVAKNGSGETEGAVWSFTTEAAPVVVDRPTVNVTVSKTSVVQGEKITIAWEVTDGDTIRGNWSDEAQAGIASSGVARIGPFTRTSIIRILATNEGGSTEYRQEIVVSSDTPTSSSGGSVSIPSPPPSTDPDSPGSVGAASFEAAGSALFPGWIGVGVPTLIYFETLLDQLLIGYGSITSGLLSSEVNGVCPEGAYKCACLLNNYIFYIQRIIDDSEYWFDEGNIETNQYISEIIAQAIKCYPGIDFTALTASAGASSALLLETSAPFSLEGGTGFILTETLASKKISELAAGSTPIPAAAESPWALSGANAKYTFLELQRSIIPSNIRKDPSSPSTSFTGLTATNVTAAIEELAALSGLSGTPTHVLFFDGTGAPVGSALLTWDDAGQLLDVEGNALFGDTTPSGQQVLVGNISGVAVIKPQDGLDSSLLQGLFTTLKVAEQQSDASFPEAVGIASFTAHTNGKLISVWLTGDSSTADVLLSGSDFEHGGVAIYRGTSTNRAVLDFRVHGLMRHASSPSTFTEITQLRFYVRAENSEPWLSAVAGTPNPGLHISMMGHLEGRAPEAWTNVFLGGSRGAYLDTHSGTTTLANKPASGASARNLFATSHIILDTSAGNATLNLPALQESAAQVNREFWITNSGSNKGTILPNGLDTIMGMAGFRLDPGASVHLIGGSTNWYVLATHNPIREISITADQMYGSLSIGSSATGTNGVRYRHFSFPAATGTDDVQFDVLMPRDWNKGPVVITLYWTGTGAFNPGTTDDVRWNCSILAHENGEDLDGTAWQDSTDITDTITLQEAMHITQDFQLDPGVSPPTLVIDQYVLRVKIARQGADVADTYGSPALLLGAKLYFLTNGNMVGPFGI